MRYLYVFLMLVCFSFAEAQLTVESYTPSNNSTNVPLNTSISVTFSAALDTTYQLWQDAGIFWNLEASPSRHYSPDHRTVTFDVALSPDKVYMFCLYFARGQGGATLQTPVGFMFTTAFSFPSFSVSGHVFGGTTGISPANSLVLLSATPISGGAPTPVSGTIADGLGGYTLPHVPNGTYYPVAGKDVSGDGGINPSNGDVVAIGDPVIVNNANLTGANLTFMSFGLVSLQTALPIADSISATLPADKSLRYVGGWDVDTLGQANDWEFLYLRASGVQGYRVQVGSLDRRLEAMDSSSCTWLVHARPILNPGSAASSAAFLANVENNGGREFRNQVPGGNLRFSCQVNLGDLRSTNFGWIVPDTSLDYWGARYSFGYDSLDHWVEVSSKSFIGNYFTGTIILVTDVKAGDNSVLPMECTLSQNFPNPFNPSTQISFSVPREEWTTLKVYNMIGREVATLAQGRIPAGEYTIRFDAGNLASGVYFCRLVSGIHALTSKMILMK